MKNFLLAFFLFLICSIIGIWYYSCKIKGLCEPTAIEAPVEEVALAPDFFIEGEGGDALFQFDGGLRINNKDATVNIPDNLLSFRDSVFAYLNQNQDKELHVQGLYRNNEDENWGMQRAEFIKNMLVDFGVNGDKIMLSATQEDFEYQENSFYDGGITMQVATISQEHEAQLESHITNKILYSEFASTNFKPDNTLRGYAAELKAYLERHPDKTVHLTGHTDDVGSHEANVTFAKKRADQVKNYLASIGIDEAKMSSLSKGETDPIADNSTEEGRAKNRRIEIIVN